MRALVAVVVGIALAGTLVGVYAAYEAVQVADDAAGIARDVAGGDAAEGESFYEAANLREGLAKLRGELGVEARVDIKIEQRSLKVTSRDRSLLVTAGGRAIATPLPGIPVDGPRVGEIDARVLERTLRAVARRARVDLDGIAYVASLSGLGQRRWGFYLESGGRWESRIDGTRLRRVN